MEGKDNGETQLGHNSGIHAPRNGTQEKLWPEAHEKLDNSWQEVQGKWGRRLKKVELGMGAVIDHVATHRPLPPHPRDGCLSNPVGASEGQLSEVRA